MCRSLVSDSPSDSSADERSILPPPLNKEVFDALRDVANAAFPGVPIIPEMETGASDSKLTMAAGIPSYGLAAWEWTPTTSEPTARTSVFARRRSTRACSSTTCT